MKKIGKILCLLISFMLILNGIYAESIEVNNLFGEHDLTQISIAVCMQIFCSIHMSVFVLMPIAHIISEKSPMKVFGILFVIRVLILIIGDFIAPILMAVIDFMSIFFGLFIFIPILNSAKTAHKNKYIEINDFPNVSDYKLTNLKVKNVENFKNEMISKVIQVEQAYCDFDYETLKSLCTTQEYIRISNEAKSLQNKNYNAIITGFDIKESKIYSVNTSEKEIIVSIVFSAAVQDFVVDNNGKLKSGSNQKTNKIYMVEFSKDITGIDIIHNCPNCGAVLEDVNSGVCKYCASIIERRNKDWNLSSLDKVNAKK